MATRLFNEGFRHLYKNLNKPVKLFIKVTSTADLEGAGFTLDADVNAYGVTSVVRTNEGVITITLKDKYVKLAGISITNLSDTFNTRFASEAVAASGTIVLNTFGNDGTPGTLADADSDTLFIELTLLNSN